MSLNDPAKTTLDRYFLVGRTPAAIVVQVPAVSIGRMEGAGTTLTLSHSARDCRMVNKVSDQSAF